MTHTATSEQLVEAQRAYFNSGATRPVAFRIEQLTRLKKAILAREKEIIAAAKADLGKGDFEAFTTEMVLVLYEINYVIRKLHGWAKARTTSPGLFNLPSKARIHHDPHGVCLIMSPWNYPFQLSLMPVVGAIAGGNTIILKPSAYSPATSHLVATLIGDTFPQEYIAAIEGGRQVNQNLLSCRFDYIFFTGSVAVGKLVMESAARHLTPVTLELGGKSPCIIDKSADIDMSAKRAAWGKCINSGQTCVAPDYFLVHQDVHEAFIKRFLFYIERFYGKDPHQNDEFPRIINEHHFKRLCTHITEAQKAGGTLAGGGRNNPEALKIEPTVIDGVSWDSPLMQEELFGPIAPIITWTDEKQMVQQILDRPRPLALYLFSTDSKQQKRIMAAIPFGGGCINDTIMHVATHTVPFGGTGESGMGGYHGKASFLTFTRSKPVIEKPFAIDVPLRYAPFVGKYRFWRKFLFTR